MAQKRIMKEIEMMTADNSDSVLLYSYAVKGLGQEPFDPFLIVVVARRQGEVDSSETEIEVTFPRDYPFKPFSLRLAGLNNKPFALKEFLPITTEAEKSWNPALRLIQVN